MSSNVLVIDDHALIRLATEQLINLQPDMDCATTCGDLATAGQLLEDQRIDITTW